MSKFKDQLIKIGNSKPELRDDLRPVIAHLEKAARRSDTLDSKLEIFHMNVLGKIKWHLEKAGYEVTPDGPARRGFISPEGEEGFFRASVSATWPNRGSNLVMVRVYFENFPNEALEFDGDTDPSDIAEQVSRLIIL